MSIHWVLSTSTGTARLSHWFLMYIFFKFRFKIKTWTLQKRISVFIWCYLHLEMLHNIDHSTFVSDHPEFKWALVLEYSIKWLTSVSWLDQQDKEKENLDVPRLLMKVVHLLALCCLLTAISLAKSSIEFCITCICHYFKLALTVLSALKTIILLLL